MLGKTINGFTIRKIIGEGGMGIVYLAEDSLGIKVAIKTLRPEFAEESGMCKRFRQECGTMRCFQGHPNVVQIHAVTECEGKPVLVMEYLDGGQDLNAYIGKNGAVQDEIILKKWLIQILQALDYAHHLSPKIIHRDIKPSNLYLTKFGDIKLLDFGIVKIIEESIDLNVTLKTLTTTTAKIGSINYMSPEQTYDSKLVDERSDIYSLGKTLHTLMTANNPFVDITLEPFKTIIEKATQNNPKHRYQSCREILLALGVSQLNMNKKGEVENDNHKKIIVGDNESQNAKITSVTIGILGNKNHGKKTLLAAISKILSQRGASLIKSLREVNHSLREEIDNGGSNMEYLLKDKHYIYVNCLNNVDYIEKADKNITLIDGAILVIDANDGVGVGVRDPVIKAREAGISKVIVFLNKIDKIIETGNLGLLEMDIRKLLSVYGYDGNRTPFVWGSALGAFNGDIQWEKKILKLMDSVDFWIPQHSIKLYKKFKAKVHFYSKEEGGNLILFDCSRLIFGIQMINLMGEITDHLDIIPGVNGIITVKLEIPISCIVGLHFVIRYSDRIIGKGHIIEIIE